MIQWHWKKFDELSKYDLYEILKIRQDVFVIEQNCVYQDIDGLDEVSWHLIAWNKSDVIHPRIHAYSRVVFPTHKYKEPSIGRVLTVKQARGVGLGKDLIKNTIANIEKELPHQNIRISAQLYLEKFYSLFGFERVCEPYDEDGILHLEMVRVLPNSNQTI